VEFVPVGKLRVCCAGLSPAVGATEAVRGAQLGSGELVGLGYSQNQIHMSLNILLIYARNAIITSF